MNIKNEEINFDKYLHYNFKIVNIVCTFNIGCDIDCRTIAMRARNTEYNPRRLPAVIIRFRNPNFTCSLFPKGKIVLLGGKDEWSTFLATKRIKRMIRKCGYLNAKVLDYKIQNVVATLDFGKRIDLLKLSIILEQTGGCFYEPELFPGLKMVFFEKEKKHDGKNVSAIIFSSGKINLVGMKSRTNSEEKFYILIDVLKRFESFICIK